MEKHFEGKMYEDRPEVCECEGCVARDNFDLCSFFNKTSSETCSKNRSIWVEKTQTKELTKDTNPKDAVGVRKVPLSVVPSGVMLEVGLGMLEGARKYGRHNYRVAGVRASVYYDAAQRHLIDWWEGTDLDQDSGLSHVTKAITALVVLRDAMQNEMWTDDRPPPLKNKNFMQEMNEKAAAIIDKYPDPLPAFTKENK